MAYPTKKSDLFYTDHFTELTVDYFFGNNGKMFNTLDQAKEENPEQKDFFIASEEYGGLNKISDCTLIEERIS
jgi:hypothetical protein